MIVICWLCVWQLVSVICDNSILLVGPWGTLTALLGNLTEASFWKTVLVSCGRIGAGLLGGILAGVLLSVLSYRFRLAEEFLRPFMTLIKAVPVASFAVILLIWWGSDALSGLVCMMVVMPHIYVNILEGLKHTDKKLLEMAKVFDMPVWNRAFYLYRPAVRPFWNSALGVCAGMAWKSGVAAEVIGLPAFSVGEGLYLSKINLDTANVFAWTAVTIVLSMITEWIINRLAHMFFAWEPSCHTSHRKGVHGAGASKRQVEQAVISVQDADKCYGDTTVIRGWNAVYETGQTYYFCTPSGSGKTTMFRLLAGLEKPDRGSVSTAGDVSVMFQEDRLCEDYSAVKNVELVTGDAVSARRKLSALLPQETLEKPCRQLSGGMRRRVALVRAMEADSQFCLLDEPFTGLDGKNRRIAMEYIRRESRGRGILIATHDSGKEK